MFEFRISIFLFSTLVIFCAATINIDFVEVNSFEEENDRSSASVVVKDPSSHDRDNECENDNYDCHLAKAIHQSMDTETDPCSDFYTFACGNWNNHSDFPSWRPFKQLHVRNDDRLKRLLEKPIVQFNLTLRGKCSQIHFPSLIEALAENNDDENTKINVTDKTPIPETREKQSSCNVAVVTIGPSSWEVRDKIQTKMESSSNSFADISNVAQFDAVSKARRFYKACMEAKNGEKDGRKFAIDELLTDRVVWKPTSRDGSWNDHDRDLFTMKLAKVHQHHDRLFFGPRTIHLSRRSKTDPEFTIILFQQSFRDSVMPYSAKKSAKVEKKLVEKYERYIKDVWQSIGFTFKDTNSFRGVRNLDEFARRIVEFEKEMSKNALKRLLPSKSALAKNSLDIDQLQNKFPFLNWKLYFKTLFSFDSHLKIDEDQPIIALDFDYFKSLNDLIVSSSQQDIMTYMRFELLATLASQLPNALELSPFKPSDPHTKRSSVCVKWTDSAFGFATGKIMEDGSPHNRQYLELLTNNILTSFEENIETVSWMTDLAKKKSKNKAKSIKENIAVPDFVFDSRLDRFYEDFDVSQNDNYVTLFTRFKRWLLQRNLRQINGRATDTSWPVEMPPDSVNAFYNPSRNDITVLAGIMQPPFFTPESAVSAVQYGGIGVVIGHEIIHGFDNHGANFDKEGFNHPLFKGSDQEQFHHLTQCVRDYYKKFSVLVDGKSVRVDGKRTEAENIADIGGTKVAYHAYLNSVEKDGESRNELPFYGFNGKKLFWLSYAQLWCEKKTPRQLRKQLKSDSHSPGAVRVLGVLQNLQEFSNDWQCDSKAQMNPRKKCTIWD
uniref:Endothelin-converting enzyme 1 n=1 Tax=Hirondellea gigas TaxID=1518452 RepID=A0A6A7FV68_9CRUS